MKFATQISPLLNLFEDLPFNSIQKVMVHFQMLHSQLEDQKVEQQHVLFSVYGV